MSLLALIPVYVFFIVIVIPSCLAISDDDYQKLDDVVMNSIFAAVTTIEAASYLLLCDRTPGKLVKRTRKSI